MTGACAMLLRYPLRGLSRWPRSVSCAAGYSARSRTNSRRAQRCQRSAPDRSHAPAERASLLFKNYRYTSAPRGARPARRKTASRWSQSLCAVGRCFRINMRTATAVRAAVAWTMPRFSACCVASDCRSAARRRGRHRASSRGVGSGKLRTPCHEDDFCRRQYPRTAATAT